MTVAGAPTAAVGERARVALAVTFIVNGLAFASFISRTPALRDRLGLSSAELGLLLLAISGGAVLTLPMAGLVVHALGAQRALLRSAVLLSGGFGLVALGVQLRSLQLIAVGLAFVGSGNGLWDVAMNVEGVEVERVLGRVLLPRFHAGYSLGTVFGAGVGAGSAALGIALSLQSAVVAVLVMGVVAIGTRSFLPAAGAPEPDAPQVRHRPWGERATLLLGVMTLAFALSEGIANDWLALTTRQAHHTSDAVAALVYACFVATMTLTRTVGGAALTRRGRVPVLRASAAVGVLGVLLVIEGPGTVYAAGGALLWGIGAALGFPVGMIAAADDPSGSALRLSVVSSIAYAAFLGGPPLIGTLSSAVGLPDSLFVVVGSFVVAALLASRAREPRPAG